MKIVCISDTHGLHGALAIPDGDVLVHAGDMSGRGTEGEIQSFLYWYSKQPHKRKLLVAGNHDLLFEKRGALARTMIPNSVTYLQDAGVCIEGVNFYGSPWQPEFCGWAFNLPREGWELALRWTRIPDDTHVLITHGPPHGVLDLANYNANAPEPATEGIHVGCEQLAKRIPTLPNLKAHIFGHIHESYGTLTQNGVQYVNAATCTRAYTPTHPPIVIEV